MPKVFSKTFIQVFGILGMIQLVTGPHLMVITGRKTVGMLLGRPIWTVTEVKILPCSNAAHSVQQKFSEAQLEDEERFVGLVKYFIQVSGIYWSSRYDLTRPFQNQADASGALSNVGFDLGSVDRKYFLNRYVCEPFLDAYALSPDSLVDHFIAVCVEGFVEIQPTTVNRTAISFGIISRRSTGRIGTRHFSRGIDDFGNVSNMVETEQLLVVEGANTVASFIQLRGSIPIYWRQIANLAYKPPLELYNSEDNSRVFTAHFRELLLHYGPVVAVNLVDGGGFEGILARKYAAEVDSLGDPDLKYVHFDFHQNCRKMQWHKLSILLDSIDPQLQSHGYFLSGKTLRTQSGIVRTNCVDCLDRTNVVQGVIGQKMLTAQFHELGLFGSRETIQEHADLLWFFKNIWADNGDAISRQYAGTGALKSDYTRTGQRTLWGALQDGFKSAVRYHKSNFADGYRQDAMDLFHGRYIVSPMQRSPFGADSLRWLLSPSALLGIALSVSALTSWFLRRYEGLNVVLRSVLSIFPALAILAAVYTHGTVFVRRPYLVPPQVGIIAKAAPAGSDRPAGFFNRKVHQI